MEVFITDRLEGIWLTFVIEFDIVKGQELLLVGVEACKTELSCHLNWPCVELASAIKCSLWGISGGLILSQASYAMLFPKASYFTHCCVCLEY